MNTTDTGIGYELSRTFSASPKALFEALTNPVVLKRIWGVQEIDVDARVGGQAVATYIAEGQDWSFTLTYTELAPQEGRLKWIARFRKFPEKETRVSVQLAPVNHGTALALRMQNFQSTEERDANKHAWENALGILADLVKRE